MLFSYTFYWKYNRRKLDAKKERWLRFEIELACSSQDKAQLSNNSEEQKQSAENLGVEEVLNLALYDQADPNNLFLASVNRGKFEKLQARQNLKIEQFSAFGCHF